MHRFYIIPNIYKEESFQITKRIVEWLIEKQHEIFVTKEIGELYGLEVYQADRMTCLKSADCAIVLGGDGTLLNAARELAPYDIPILGVNLGNFGFLAEVEAKDLLYTLEQIEQKNFCVEDRMMLQTTLVEQGIPRGIDLALNDVVATRTSISRMVGYSIYVNSVLVNHYAADGIIVSTPTGSTAYNLSAGGPILAPHNEMLVITPICPHSLTARSIVLSGSDQVKISFDINRTSWDKDLKVTLDGQEVFSITNDTDIIIEKSKIKMHLIKLKGNDFYTLLRRKLGNK